MSISHIFMREAGISDTKDLGVTFKASVLRACILDTNLSLLSPPIRHQGEMLDLTIELKLDLLIPFAPKYPKNSLHRLFLSRKKQVSRPYLESAMGGKYVL